MITSLTHFVLLALNVNAFCSSLLGLTIGIFSFSERFVSPTTTLADYHLIVATLVRLMAKVDASAYRALRISFRSLKDDTRSILHPSKPGYTAVSI
ncbi:hypothetical protein DENSPDRAFT_126833 [Dentipellis sp. KUC8613]|nr:hypothetical protein DENSPDRAFT_126833 [Dentipellis sp. KUC8613]